MFLFDWPYIRGSQGPCSVLPYLHLWSEAIYVSAFKRKSILRTTSCSLQQFFCATTGLAYATLTAQYTLLQLVLHGFEGDLAFELLGEIPRISKQENAATNIWWLVIFSVKMAFLFFFRRLISRLRSLNLWWWFATTFTMIAGLVSIAVSWLTCPYFTVEGLLCEQRP